MRFHKITSLLTFQSRSGNHLEGTSLLRYFNKVAGHSGVFICGQNPHLILLTVRGELRCHPLHIDGPIICFAPFHNVNCSQGFLYFNSNDKLRISILPTHLSYDEPWPLRKVYSILIKFININLSIAVNKIKYFENNSYLRRF